MTYLSGELCDSPHALYLLFKRYCQSIAMNHRVIGIRLGFLISVNVNAAIKGAFVSTTEDAPVIIHLSANVSSEASFSSVTVSIISVTFSLRVVSF